MVATRLVAILILVVTINIPSKIRFIEGTVILKAIKPPLGTQPIV
jgi:hypothetical protein